MKKLFYLWAAAIFTAASFTSCLSDDNNSGNGGTMPTGYITRVYVVNAGSWGTIDGTLTKITGTYTSSSSSTTSTTTGSLNFTSTTQGTLGDTANDVLIYGNKMYVVVTGTNEVLVYDKNSLSLLERINTQTLLGGTAGCQPRHIAAANNLVYVSTYGVENNSAYSADAKGYVAAIDTANFALQKQYEVGPYPEDLVAAAIGSSTTTYYVYVANSDYGMGNGSISTITVSNGSGTVSTSAFDGIKNPVQIEVGGNYFLIQDMATYNSSTYAKLTDDAIWAWGGNTTSAPTKVIDGASMMAPLTLTTYGGSRDVRIYFVKDPYGTPSYGCYSVSSGATTSLDLSGLAQPCAIGADPYTGYIYVASLAAKGDYNSSGYVNIYDYSGSLVKSQLGAGVNPTAFAFDFKYIYNSSSIYTSQY